MREVNGKNVSTLTKTEVCEAKAVYETLNGSIDEHCPASVLRMHENAKLYLDNESSKLL